MNLRQKLFTTYGGLVLMVILTTGAALWSTIMWQNTNKLLVDHYRSSMLLLEIEALVFRASKELPDALTALDDDAEKEFAALIIPVAKKFERWEALAATKEESDQVDKVRTAYQQVVTDTQQFFNLVKKKYSEDAARFMEEQLEKASLHTFQTQADKVIALDREYRQHVRDRVDWVRRTGKIIFSITTFGAMSLMLLLLAYLRSDMFAPLQVLIEALKGVAAGDYKMRITVDRKDELGEVQDVFNRMVESIAERQRLSSRAFSASSDKEPAHRSQDLPSRLTLHRLIARLKAQVQQVSQQVGQKKVHSDSETIIASLDEMLGTVVRFAEFGFPLDLNLARFNMRGLLYEVLQRFHEIFAQRAVGFEIDVSPEVDSMIGDRQKLRAILGEIIENALTAIPEQGGYIGVRATLEDEGRTMRLEFADNGVRAEPQMIDKALSLDEFGDLRPAIGLAMTNSIVEQHGGKLVVNSQPGKGNHVSISLPRNM